MYHTQVTPWEASQPARHKAQRGHRLLRASLRTMGAARNGRRRSHQKSRPGPRTQSCNLRQLHAAHTCTCLLSLIHLSLCPSMPPVVRHSPEAAIALSALLLLLARTCNAVLSVNRSFVACTTAGGASSWLNPGLYVAPPRYHAGSLLLCRFARTCACESEKVRLIAVLFSVPSRSFRAQMNSHAVGTSLLGQAASVSLPTNGVSNNLMCVGGVSGIPPGSQINGAPCVLGVFLEYS